MADQSEATVTPLPSRKKWVIGGKEFVQDELSFIEKNEFFSLLAGAIDKALEKGLGLAPMFEVFGDMDLDTLRGKDPEGVLKELLDETRDKDPEAVVTNFARLMLRVFAAVPELTPSAITLALSVPEEDRDGFRRAVLPMLSDDDGFGIMRLFFAQNSKAILDFGKRWWVEVISPLVSSSTG